MTVGTWRRPQMRPFAGERPVQERVHARRSPCTPWKPATSDPRQPHRRLQLLDHLVPNNSWGYPEDAKGYEFDLAKAEEYCDKAVAEGA